MTPYVKGLVRRRDIADKGMRWAEHEAHSCAMRGKHERAAQFSLLARQRDALRLRTIGKVGAARNPLSHLVSA